ncbi:notchless protein homolog 1-like [Pomacea canaliculata]|uniref:notchless protein homolog 1-like n=1 Tax=Pomacea canaliculata TaxID=400727 RepID=UPI000D729ED7|nr:notchless protein homolog 1-like [Pomacea canaliculata]
MPPKRSKVLKDENQMKKQKQISSDSMKTNSDEEDTDKPSVKRILTQFKSENGEVTSTPIDMPVNVTVDNLQALCNTLLKTEEETSYSFFVNDVEIREQLDKTVDKETLENSEKVLEIVYQPQAVFRVRAVTRCTSTVEGHADPVLAAAFNADGRYLASGSADKTVRLWDIYTETPQYTCKGHRHSVLCLAWSVEGKKLASGCQNGEIFIWNPSNGKQIGKPLTGHKKWINSLQWRPLHLDSECRFLASASKDATIRKWDTLLGTCVLVLSSHLLGVSCLRWGGTDLLYSASQDRTIKVWRASDGVLCRTLQGHGHWVNTMALNTDYVMRTGAFDPAKAELVHTPVTMTAEELSKKAKDRYEAVKGSQPEMMVSGSDDSTLFLWNPESATKPLARMTGHQQLINQVCFSPDTRLIASASFDKSVKLWDGRTGKFLATFRGHVNRVYQVVWSADSRLLCSGGADSTLKVWDVPNRKLAFDLPGHADEVYAVDWSPDGQRVVSGGKDKALKIWRS